MGETLTLTLHRKVCYPPLRDLLPCHIGVMEADIVKRRRRKTNGKTSKEKRTGMSVEARMELREQVDTALSGFRSTLERQ